MWVTFDRASLLIRAPQKIFPQIMGWGGGGEGTAVRPSLRPISFYGLRQYVTDLFPAASFSLPPFNPPQQSFHMSLRVHSGCFVLINEAIARINSGYTGSKIFNRRHQVTD